MSGRREGWMNKGRKVVHQQDNFFIYKFNFKIILLKFWVNFLEIRKEHKLENGVYEVLGKFDKILNKLCGILEQVLKRLEFLYIVLQSTI